MNLHRAADRRTSSRSPNGCRKLGASGLLLLTAVVTILGVVGNSEAMPSREYGSIDGVSATPRATTYRSSRDRVDEDEESPIGTRPGERRAGRREPRPREENRGSPSPRGGEIHQSLRSNFVAEPDSACEGKTFCEYTVSPYPEAHVRGIISTTASLNILSSVNMVDIDTRFDISDGETVCNSQTSVVYPRAAKNGNNEWLFVVQDDQSGFRQGVRVENCGGGTSEGTCQIVSREIPGYEASCKQKYVSRVMAALDKNGTALMDKFSMPSSCCCEIKISGIASRFGIGLRSNQRQSTAVTPTRKRRL